MSIAKLRPDDPRDIFVTKFEIENEDVLHLKNLYKLVHEWLLDEGFYAADTQDPGDDRFESLYLDITRASGDKEHHIWWRTIQIPRNNKYYRYFLKIDWQTLNVKKIEIMHKGQKFGTNKADVIFRVEAWLQLDYDNKWKESAFLRFFDKWFRERFYLDKVKTYKQDLYAAAFRLHTTVKQYLQLKAPVDWGRPFHPERGV